MRVVGDFSRFNARRFPNKPALIMGEEKLTYLELDAKSNAIANGLLSAGIQPGDRVAILALSSPEFAIVTQAIAKAGAMFVPVNARFSAPEIAVLLNDAEPRVLFAEPEFLPALEEALPSVSAPPKVVVIRSAEAHRGLATMEAMVAEYPETPPNGKVDPASPTMIMYTGGTTGAPKGVVYSHELFLRCVEGAVVGGDLVPTEVMHLTMPLFHNGGYAAMLCPALLTGATVVCYRGSFEPERILADIERYRITLTQWIPTMLTMLLPYVESSGRDLSSLRKIFYGAMPIMPSTLDEVRRLFPSVGLYQIYATTDAGLVGFLRPEDHVEMSQVTARPVFNTESRIVDADGSDVPVGGVGEIIVNLETSGMLYYWRNEEGTRNAIRDGWLYTGDLARRERDGYFTLVDRKNFMIISGGENIYPKEVEEVISGHPAVNEVAVFGIPDDKYGETVCAAISLRPGMSATADEIVSFCDGRLARYKRPRRVDFLAELPKTPVGKLAKAALRDPYWAERTRRV